MPIEDRLNLQRQVLEVLETRRRQSYRGPVALQMRLATTDRTPAHLHTIAKNILDLLGRPLPELATSRKGLLYFDDVQVHALSVSCNHGAENPEIDVQVQSLGNFRDDLGLALHVLKKDGGRESDNADVGDEIDHYSELLADRKFLRAQIGDEAFETLLDTTRRDAQRRFLGHAKLRPQDLAYFFRASDLDYREHRIMLDDFAKRWEEIFRTTPLRILIGELPQTPGSSDGYRAEIDQRIRAFRSRHGRLLMPLCIPVALDVIIKPPPPLKPALHDLDNVMRTYLVPKVTELLEPPSDIAWTFDRSVIDRHDGDHGDHGSWLRNRLEKLPRSARIGLIRYEAWRIPREPGDTSPGFLSAAVVSDDSGYEDSISRIARLIDHWAESVD